MELFCLYPGGKRKAFTLSYDDGVRQDARLVQLLNEKGVKATFNLNLGKQSRLTGWTHESGLEIRYLDKSEIVPLYAGHEVAVHTYTHPHLETLTKAEIVKEIRDDKLELEQLFGSLVTGLAYPFGSYDKRVIELAKAEGLEYARTIKHAYDFSIPEELMEWEFSCHHGYEGLPSLAKEFLGTEQELALFAVWGHSYEFDVDKNWAVMDELVNAVSGRDDTWYATNGQIARYLLAMQQLSLRDGKLINPSGQPLWLQVDGELQVIS
ncbi:MAG: polysaccharide deacetylase family protein [Christensenellaceae bacterium]|nr:polysaccharide deacetylase family protein [Christensenellaceae bacterium]